MVLGVQWMKDIGPMTLDLNLLTMEFTYNDQKVQLQGINTIGTKLSMMNGTSFEKFCAKQDYGVVAQLSCSSTEVNSQVNPQLIKGLLEEFNPMF